jgi:lipoprotein-releasing system permease protein
MRRFELKVAWRHLIMSHGQTELTVGAVAVGVLLVVFLSSLINGLQIGLVEDVVGSIPHVSVEAASPDAKPLWQVAGRSSQALTSLEKMTTRSKRIEQWERMRGAITRIPGVKAVAPAVEGDGLVTRGAKTIGARIVGVIPSEQMQVVSLKNRIVEGDFSKVDEQSIAVGVKMADDLGVRVGNRLRVISNLGVTETFIIVAIFDMGVEQANESTVYMGLQAGQTMFKIGKDVTNLNIRVTKMYEATAIADQIRGITSLTVTSWMESNVAFLDTMRMQNTAAAIIQAMTLLASAFGVASVMIVFVVQKSKDIGILKSMGATCAQIRRVFILEGLGVGLGGALIGSGVGTGLCYLVTSLTIPGQMFGGRQATIVPMQFNMTYVLLASVVALAMGLLSSIVPAHRAAKLDPVQAIRRG